MLKSYVLTINLEKGHSDLQSPAGSSFGWFKASAGITMKVWVFNIL